MDQKELPLRLDDHNQKRSVDYESVDHNHSVCQKLKAENECFHSTIRTRIGKILETYQLPPEIESKILEIIELILEISFKAEPALGSALAPSFSEPKFGTNLSYCQNIHSENEFHKSQYFKISYFLECLEKSKLSAAHLHRISIFLQTGIFEHLSIQEYFSEMLKTEVLYECNKCKIFAPIDASLEIITSKFYTSVRNRCKECFKEETKDRYKVSKAVKAAKTSVPISKIYLCMKCGEDNYINFYERNKSKCKFCILSEKRGLYALGPGEMAVAASASKKHHCKHCHTEDPKNFRDTYKSVCYACFLEQKRLKGSLGPLDSKGPKDLKGSYFCKDCETEEPGKFRRGYKSQCYECFLKSKRIAESAALGYKLGPAGSGPKRKVECKHCHNTDYRNFNEGMDTLCVRCEEIELQSFICSKCNIESLRSNYTEAELNNLDTNPAHKILCNICNPEVNSPGERKPYKCDNCNETNPSEFYEGFKSKCKTCTREIRRLKYETKANAITSRLTKPLKCLECGTQDENEFYLGHKTKCKKCI